MSQFLPDAVCQRFINYESDLSPSSCSQEKSRNTMAVGSAAESNVHRPTNVLQNKTVVAQKSAPTERGVFCNCALEISVTLFRSARLCLSAKSGQMTLLRTTLRNLKFPSPVRSKPGAPGSRRCAEENRKPLCCRR